MSAVADAPTTARNAPCPCGSGRRYKACHGRVATPAMPAASLDPVLSAALDLHRRGRLAEARSLYQRALMRAPRSADAAHMLGVVQICEGDLVGALRTLRDVAARFQPTPHEVVRNLAIPVAALLAVRAAPETEALWLDYVASRPAAPPPGAGANARVSVVVPSHNHAAFVEAAVASALEQTRPADEIVVIDDGSSDSSPARLRAMAARHDRIRLVAREGRGAAATINDAVRLSRGDYVNVLNSDDRFAPDRLAAMADAVAGAGAAWGFSRCAFVGADAQPLPHGASAQADSQRNALDGIGAYDTIGFEFIAGNPATSTGTLFFSRALFDRLGGFRDYRYVHDWAFCLAATLEEEPVFVPRDLYDYRLHGANTIFDGSDAAKAETVEMLAAFHRRALEVEAPRNRHAPVPAVWGRTFALRVIEARSAWLLAPGTVERLADELLAEIGG